MSKNEVTKKRCLFIVVSIQKNQIMVLVFACFICTKFYLQKRIFHQ